MPKAVCPNSPHHKEFVTVVHEMHNWLVDKNGDFIEDLGFLETSADPDSGNVWTCKECGAIAKVE